MRLDEERLRDIVEHADLIAAHLPATAEDLDADVVLSAALGRDRRGGRRPVVGAVSE